MKILFYGAGVIGSLYAARLKESGQDVSILARGWRSVNLHVHGMASYCNKSNKTVDLMSGKLNGKHDAI